MSAVVGLEQHIQASNDRDLLSLIVEFIHGSVLHGLLRQRAQSVWKECPPARKVAFVLFYTYNWIVSNLQEGTYAII